MDSNNRQVDLCKYRLQEAKEELEVAENCLRNSFFKATINRAYYSAFYSIKAVLALGAIDFKRHKDVVAYFNKEYVATGIFQREVGRRLANLKQLREKSDYDDFYLASKEGAMEQVETARIILKAVEEYLKEKGDI